MTDTRTNATLDRFQIETLRTNLKSAALNLWADAAMKEIVSSRIDALCDMALSARSATRRSDWQMGIADSIRYLESSTFGEREMPTVNGCLALLRSLHSNKLWGPTGASPSTTTKR